MEFIESKYCNNLINYFKMKFGPSILKSKN